MMKGFRSFLALCALTAAGCGGGGGPESPDFAPQTTVESLQIFEPGGRNVTGGDAGTRAVGQTLQL
ncbi:MAG: hypothetical protein ACREUF_09585, partial [Solimonas sp.]